MRIKYEKGVTPEIIADHLVEFIRDNDLVIGSVNVYIQTYDEEMKAAKFGDDDKYLIVSPAEKTKKVYADDVAQIRRKRFKAV